MGDVFHQGIHTDVVSRQVSIAGNYIIDARFCEL